MKFFYTRNGYWVATIASTLSSIFFGFLYLANSLDVFHDTIYLCLTVVSFTVLLSYLHDKKKGRWPIN